MKGCHMGVSKMVKIMETPIKMDDLGENPLFLEIFHILVTI